MVKAKEREEGRWFFHCYGYFDGESKKFILHCLELDLVADGNTKEEAGMNMLDVIEAHLRFAAKNDNWENVFRPAPAELWAQFADLAFKKTGARIEFAPIKGSLAGIQFAYA